MTGSGAIAAVSAFVGLGILAGLVHLKLLSWNVRALTCGWHNWAACAIAPARVGMTIAAFSFAANYGAMALMAVLAGFLLARAVLLRFREMLLP